MSDFGQAVRPQHRLVARRRRYLGAFMLNNFFYGDSFPKTFHALGPSVAFVVVLVTLFLCNFYLSLISQSQPHTNTHAHAVIIFLFFLWLLMILFVLLSNIHLAITIFT